MNNGQPKTGGMPFPDEAAHLEEINRRLEQALKEAQADVERIDREYRDSKRYMADYRGEIDPHEMFQNELLLRQTDQTGAFAVVLRDRIARLKDSPYFARIDFQSNNGKEPEKFYIGRFTFSQGKEPLIFDWRAPVSSMFYDYEAGPAGYDAPMGRIDGELKRKRQFKIKNGIMEYALESAAHVQDDILQKELSHTSDEKMKSIIATIQKEQNRIIRSEQAGTMIIQGVAGSGKTSIALHRIAFLLYRQKDRLAARNVTILSPNRVFGDYISNVIPELGEEPIYELSFSDIAEIGLENVIGFEPEPDPLEVEDEKWIERIRFKSSPDFACLLEEYIQKMPDRIFIPTDYAFGRFTVDRKWIRERFLAYGKYPVKRRLSMTADDIYNRLQNENIWQEDLPKARSILKSLTAMLRFKNTPALYRDFYKWLERPQMYVMPARNKLEWMDVFPFLYLHAAFEGIKESKITKHLVIDEMQDYTPIQYAVINRMFPCQKTILGDFGQYLNPYHTHTLADLRRIYDGAEYVELNKSYRSTYEIMALAKRIGAIGALEAMVRHGEEPALITCKNEQDEILKLKKAVRDFRAGENSSLGIITKTEREAEKLYAQLSDECGVNLIRPESTHFAGGISIASVRMAKGLEFDEVLIPHADSLTYQSDYDRSLLYIACTRAMHKLTLFYCNEPSRFLPL
ncbi:ATP-binding domain-containing protein [[Clostridium] symbiosum]|uniref:HelD family protein n=1 Tax=Clostridium symbiosum TaxID=1512 RepID=UPI001D093268|nr:ATP-binding domain-containing protein [[Clostridium] symbiosum]MCB6609497.1 AAA family ATPase [[Clostridium] symbiosum]MCB6929510.1 AAA family ATPase [[Clostridium] symbiosum]